jgi:hypothetical protein
LLIALIFCLTVSVAHAADRGDPAARLLSAESASERWELTARFESGHVLFTQFLITNMGVGDHHAAVIGHVIFPDGKTKEFRNGRLQGQWNLSPDHLRIEVGTSSLDLHKPQYRLHITKRNTQIDLRFRPNGPPVWSDAAAPDGYAFDLLAVSTPIEGTIKLKGMEAPVTVRGTAALTHSWVQKTESKVLQRRLEFFSLQGDEALYVSELTPPQGAPVRWLVVSRRGQIVHQTQAFTLKPEGEADPAQREYPLPATLQFTGDAGEGRIRAERTLLRYDPLDDLPQPFRFIVALKMRPHWVGALAPFKMLLRTEAEQSPIRLQGTGILILSFANPM